MQPQAQCDDQVKALLSKLTLKEKISLLAGKDDWNTAGVERLGIPSLALVDGPHGVRIVDDGRRWKGATTSFPTGASMATSWNPALIEKVSGAIAEEVLGVGGDVLLGPCVNIVRHPLNGRNFETFTEDPFLAGRLAVAYIRGVQTHGVGTSLKHFACNNQEVERMRGSSEVDERTLREIYLPAFESAVKEAKPWTVMCAYNRINGAYASENRYLLNDILRKEWGFTGVVVSDWGATHSTIESVSAGLDIEMPGPAKFTKGLAAAVDSWQIDEAVIDRSVSRILRMLLRSGRMGGAAAKRTGCINTPAHERLARELAEESIVLLKNDRGLLPLQLHGVKSIAVLGPNANELQLSGGGSSEIDRPARLVTPLDALRERLGDKVELRLEAGALNYVTPPIFDIRRLKPAQGEGYGLWGEYFNNTELSGKPQIAQVDGNMNLWWGGSSPAPDISPQAFSARWTGTLTVPQDASYTLKISRLGECSIFLDGKRILAYRTSAEKGADAQPDSVTLNLKAGKAYGLRMEYSKRPTDVNGGFIVSFGITTGSDLAGQLERAVKLAATSDIAIVFAGVSRRFEQEGSDRLDLRLPGNQDELIRAVARANPRTIVVVNAGAPIAMPWVDEVPAILDAFYPGQDGGSAIIDILTGAVNPSGKLAVTFPKRIEDTPAFLDYPGTRESRYG
ncbi:MAG: glycoside hydrolase family 3 C-terminal domain-containing protein, partial [Planctomycetota bacterium]